MGDCRSVGRAGPKALAGRLEKAAVAAFLTEVLNEPS
jgi:hypothetical protein